MAWRYFRTVPQSASQRMWALLCLYPVGLRPGFLAALRVPGLVAMALSMVASVLAGLVSSLLAARLSSALVTGLSPGLLLAPRSVAHLAPSSRGSGLLSAEGWLRTLLCLYPVVLPPGFAASLLRAWLLPSRTVFALPVPLSPLTLSPLLGVLAGTLLEGL